MIHVILYWMGTQAAENWILAANLVAVGVYVWYTRAIKKASNAQSEGLSKPVITLRAISEPITTSSHFKGILDRKVHAHLEPNSSGDIELINIGNGPAMEVVCEIPEALSSRKPLCRVAPYLFPKESLPLLGEQEVGDVIVCSYRSISGNKYKAEFELGAQDEKLVIKKFRVRKG